MKLKNVKCTCGACPSQWEATTEDNKPVYIRYRWGYLSIREGEIGGDVWSAVDGNEIYGSQLGEDLDGVISWDKVNSIVEGI